MATGGFIGFTPTGRSIGNAGANSIFLTPLVAQQNGIATAVLIDTPNATSSISFKALIYDASHSALLATGSAVTSVAANYNRLPLTANLNVVAGTTYYVGYVCSASANVTIQSSGGPGAWFLSGGQSVPSPANPLVGGVSQTTTLMCALELDGTGSAGFGFGLDQGAGIILSSSNTLATFSSAVNLGARSIVTHLPGDGKFYAEIAVGGTPGTSVGIGIHLGAWGTNQGINLRYGIGALSALGNVVGGASLGLPYAAGDVIGISYDAINNFLWWNKNNGSWFGASTTAGNPTVPSGGLATGTVLWPTTLMVGTSSSASPTFTLRDTTGALQYAPPAGFSAWSSAAGPGVIGTQARAMVLA